MEMKSIRCNLCGKSFDFWDEQENYVVHRIIGYGSKHDGDCIDLHVCCGCMDALIDSCEISPVTSFLDSEPA